MSYQILNMDCVDAMQLLIEDNSVDAIVTDPPYGLSFMGKKWDYDVPSVDVWREAFRVLKPGGHLLAFAGTRTQHRMAVNIEDAGFEIRDLIAWVYGSGFPKSLDVSKAIDKMLGEARPVIETRADRRDDGTVYAVGHSGAITSAEPITAAAAAWKGFGTSLKPALEPITVARKPLVGTVAANVLSWGTGALNVDGCRVEHNEECRMMAPSQANIDNPSEKHRQAGRREAVLELKPEGRWPANLIHDGSDEVLAAFPDAPGQMAKASSSSETRKNQNTYGEMKRGSQAGAPRAEIKKSAARFFYCAKASKSDRGEGNVHPTVKPLALMRYLCRLVTPPGGLILDPFTGSGTTGVAALLEGFRFTGIERDEAYVAIAEARLASKIEQMLNSGVRAGEEVRA